MKNPVVIDRFDNAGLKIEVFSDGDCLINVDRPGFFQLSKEALARIAKKSSTPKSAAPKAGDDEGDSDSHESDPIDRKITPGTAEDGTIAWDCVLTDKKDPGQTVKHRYASRSLARKSTFDVSIGDAGRLA